MAKWRHFIYRKRYGYLRYLLLFCALCPGFDTFIHCSCATEAVLLTVLLGAEGWLAAARAPEITTATRTVYGSVPWVLAVFLFMLIWIQARLVITLPALYLAPTVCAVSWVWAPRARLECRRFTAVRHRCEFFLRRCLLCQAWERLRRRV